MSGVLSTYDTTTTSLIEVGAKWPSGLMSNVVRPVTTTGSDIENEKWIRIYFVRLLVGVALTQNDYFYDTSHP